ncbi:MAG: zinc-ribbon domain-containing protein [Alphaproteobacteria bacterium]|nr:zinc-ribbon domain-containing protein [Alphaproteobacteria bacterium]
MKIVCDFCKTEYSLDRIPSTSVKCAVCGHTWVPRRPLKQNLVLKFLAALCALIAACVFAVVVIVNYQSHIEKKKPIIARIDKNGVNVIVEEGVEYISVSGAVINQSEDIYGVPNINIISYDKDKKQIAKQTFLPPATLLEPNSSVGFKYILNVDPQIVQKVDVELKDM